MLIMVRGKDGYQVYIHYDCENKDGFGRGKNYIYILGYECGLDQLGWFSWQRLENPIQND